MRLTQSGNTVTGTVSLGSLGSANATGTVTSNNHLNLNASIVTTTSGIRLTWDFEGWDSVVSGNTMTGTFAVRISSSDVSTPGAVRYTMSLVNVTRVSSTLTTMRLPSNGDGNGAGVISALKAHATAR